MSHHLDKHGNKHEWDDTHIEAGYHLKKWEVPTKDAGVIGQYDLRDGQMLDISWLAPENTALGQAELQLTFFFPGQGEDEHAGILTVLDEATALEYLVMHGAVKRT